MSDRASYHHTVLTGGMKEMPPTAPNRWKDPSFPKSGWVCVEMYDDLDGEVARGDADLTDLRKVCEVCGQKLIRYVHVLAHDDYGGTIEAGCVCAGRLEMDVDRAKAREKEFLSRKTFATRKGWAPCKRFDDDAYSIKVDGHKIIVFHKGGRLWKVEALPFGDWRRAVLGRQAFQSEQDAKAAAFDALNYLKHHHDARRAANH